ncbi:MAG: DUF4876 domain-containing protein [Candidatus Cryptobacteroides sp.]
MKKLFAATLTAIAAMLALSSCEDKSLKFYNLEITVDETGFDAEVPVPESYQVTFTNTNTGEVLEYTTVNKKISVIDIPAGVYDVVATARLSLYNYLGTVKGALINSDESLSVIKVAATRSSSLVIKEVFYCCSRTPENTMYLKDNFFEIYNNGPDAVYVDGLCIGTSSNYSSASINFANADGMLVLSDGTATSLKADDYLCLNSIVWQIPGNGSTYLLNPGESFVIASYATDHTTADKNPNSIDLSGADFETVCDKFIEKGQVDNESVPNLKLVIPHNPTITNQYMPSVLTAGFILFTLNTPEEEIPIVGNYNLEQNTVTGYYLPVPRKDILDGLNWVKNATTDAWLPETIDAGKTYVSGTYVNESVSRKIEKTSDEGYPVFLDTNNSSNDFEVNPKPETKRHGVKNPSWKNL